MPQRVIHQDPSIASFKHSTHHVPSGRITSGPSLDTLDNILTDNILYDAEDGKSDHGKSTFSVNY